MSQPDSIPDSIDAYAPAEIAQRVERASVAKAGLATLPTLVLAVLAGAFIAFGAMLYVVVVTDSGLGFGPERLLGGLAFSLGLILVLVGGAELFTGNSLIVFAWADGKITAARLLRNWGLVYFGNFVGATATALAVHWSGIHGLAEGAVGGTVVRIAEAKVGLSPLEAFVRGILCNVLVCLAVWLCMSARTVADRVLAILFPITAFVATGMEHCVANMYFIPAGMLAASSRGAPPGADPEIGMTGFLVHNLIPVTVGNVIGGTVLVGLVYWFVYLRPRRGAGR